MSVKMVEQRVCDIEGCDEEADWEFDEWLCQIHFEKMCSDSWWELGVWQNGVYTDDA